MQRNTIAVKSYAKSLPIRRVYVVLHAELFVHHCTRHCSGSITGYAIIMTQPNSSGKHFKCEGLACSGFHYSCNAIYLMNVKHGNSIIFPSTEWMKRKTRIKPLFYQMTWKESNDSIIESQVQFNSIKCEIQFSK